MSVNGSFASEAVVWAFFINSIAIRRVWLGIELHKKVHLDIAERPLAAGCLRK
jgi:hypothetical protein